MITSFEVGAVFKIVNDASPQLRILIEQVAKLDTLTKSVTDNFAKLGASFAPLGVEAGRASEKMLAGLTDFNLGIDRSIGKVAELREAMKSLSVPSIGGGGGGGIRRGHPGAGPTIRPPTPSAGGWSVGGMAGDVAIAGSLGAMGLYEESMLQDTAQKAFTASNMNFPGGGLAGSPEYKRFRGAILDTYGKTGMPLGEIEKASLVAWRQLAGMPVEDRFKLLPSLLAGGALEARQKGTSVEAGTEAIVGLAHMQRGYGVDEISKSISELGYLSSTSPASLEAITRAAGYAVPTLVGAGFDSSQILAELTAMQRGGILNSKSGTWIRELAVRSLPGTSLMSKVAFAKHEKGLQAMGLVDADGKPTFVGADGKPDFQKLISIAGAHMEAMDPMQRLATERQVFGAQGSGALSFLSDPKVRALTESAFKEMKDFKGGAEGWDAAAANSPIVKFKKLWADLNTILIDTGATVLKLAAIFDVLDGGLKLLTNKGLQDLAGKDYLGTGAWMRRKSTRGGEVPLLRGIIPPPRDFTDPDSPAPGASPMSGMFAVPGFGWTDGSGKSAASLTIHDGVLAALNDWGGGMGASGSTSGGFGGRYGHGAGGRFGHNATGEHAIFSDWSKAGASPAEREAFIRKTAAALGIDPGIAMRVARSEGFHVFTGDQGHSHGDFQLYDRGEGALFHAATGLDPADPKNWMAADKWALTRASKNGWGAWHGARNTGIGDHQGIGHIHVTIDNHLDGKKIAQNTTHHQTRNAMFPRQAPFHSSYRYPTSPDIGWETG